MRPTLSMCVFWSVIALVLLVPSYQARNCRTDYNDLGSRTIRASLVFEGVARSRISVAQHPQLHRIEFEVLKVLKGELQGKSSKPRMILVGDFGQPDVDNCVAPDVTIDSSYIVFVDNTSALTSLPEDKPSRNSANRSANSKNTGSSGSRVYHVSSFPETASEKAKKEVRNYAKCTKCGRPPKITKQPKNMTESAQRKLRLHCRASGKPTPRVTWFKNDIPLNNDKRITIKENRRDSRLQIKNIDVGDSGVYRCVARNLLGNVSSQAIWVNVKGNTPKPFSKLCADQSFCLNDGICYEMTQLNKKQFCQCAKSFVGSRCEEKKNDQMVVVGKEIHRYNKRKRKRHLHQNLL